MQTTPITLHLQDVPIRELLDRFAAEAGTEFAYGPEGVFDRPAQAAHGDPPAPPAVASIDLDAVPFWRAMARVSDATGFCPEFAPDPAVTLPAGAAPTPQLDFTPHPFPPPPDLDDPRGLSVASGPFLVQAVGMKRWETRLTFFAFDGGPAEEGGGPHVLTTLYLNLRLFTEPRYRRALSGEQRVVVTEAITETGASLLGGTTQSSVPSGAGWVQEASVYLSPDAAEGCRRVALVRGVVSMRLVTASQAVDVAVGPDDAGRRQEFGKLSLTSQGTSTKLATPSAVRPDYFVALDLDGAGQLDGPWSGRGNFGGRAYDAEGRLCSTTPFYARPDADGRLNVAIRCLPDVGPPVRLVGLIELETADCNVPFEFHDLPLP